MIGLLEIVAPHPRFRHLDHVECHVDGHRLGAGFVVCHLQTRDDGIEIYEVQVYEVSHPVWRGTGRYQIAGFRMRLR